MKRTPLTLILLPILVFSFFHNTYACACCAEPGTYFSVTSPVDDYEKEMLAGIKFSPTAALYMDAAGFEVIRGLAGFEDAWDASETGADFYEIGLSGGFGNGKWMWTLKLGNLSGSIELPLPAEHEYFGADIHDSKQSGGGGPLLYKELRFKGKVGSGTGFFSEGIRNGADFRLVFQGRGNGCNNAEDFSHWHLSVNGRDARYSFYGELPLGRTEGAPKGALVPAPKFEDHPAAAWNGRKKALNLNSHPNARTFRTRLREAWSGDVNFAGNFIFTYWGCGTNCLSGAIIDAKTGRVYFPDELQGMGVGLPGTDFEREPFELRKDSSLFIFYGASGEEADPGTRWLLWDGAKFIKLAERPE